ncbi:MAG: tetratricopeptide repeat protein [Wenzhouxiangella sp.]
MKAEVIEKLIDQGRDGYEARLAAGQARLKSGDLDQAIAHLQKAAAFKPEQTMVWQELGRAQLDNGDLTAARRAWVKGSAVARTNGDKQAEKVMAVWLKRLDRSEA